MFIVSTDENETFILCQALKYKVKTTEKQAARKAFRVMRTWWNDSVFKL